MAGFRICFAASELAPFAKAGGLGDVSAALPRYLHSEGHDLRVFVPLYASIQNSEYELQAVHFLHGVPIQIGPHRYEFSIYTAPLPNSSLWVYFVHCPALFGRPSLYTDDPDEHLRFAVLSLAAIECCQRMGFSPDVFHCNDWQTALIPLYLKTRYAWDGERFGATRTVLTIHNIGYQGVFSAASVGDLGLAEHAPLLHQGDLEAGVVNFLKSGVLYADALNTVSPTYALEVQGPYFGAGLDALLRTRSSSFVGILNGVDYDEWSPEADPFIPFRFSADELEGKTQNKQALLQALELEPTEDAPIIGIVSRLTGQKGLDVLFDTLPAFVAANDVRLAVLGSGEPRYEEFFAQMQRRFPGKVCFYRGYNNALAHLIEAGADMFLMPSRYEPCGLNQLYSLRYGTVPIVHKTGGLADTVQQYEPATGNGNGIVFEHLDATAIRWALGLALSLYRQPDAWLRMMRNGMREDFSWSRQGALYVRLYETLL